MKVSDAIEIIITLGKAMHEKYVELGKADAEWAVDLGEQIATGLFARNKFFIGKHSRGDTDEAYRIVCAEIMAGRLPTVH